MEYPSQRAELIIRRDSRTLMHLKRIKGKDAKTTEFWSDEHQPHNAYYICLIWTPISDCLKRPMIWFYELSYDSFDKSPELLLKDKWYPQQSTILRCYGD